MLDPVIREHIKEQDDIEKQLRDDIDAEIQGISIDEAIANPSAVFLAIVEKIEGLVIGVYAEKAIQSGVKVAERIEDEKRKIVIQDTDDADINKEAEKELLEDRQDGRNINQE